MRKIENLRKRYPLAIRYILRDNFLWILVYLSFAYLYFSFSYPGYSNLTDSSLIADPLMGFLIGAAAVLSAKLIYSVLYFLTLSLRLSEDRLILAYGIIWREKHELFIDKIVDVYVARSPIDYLFGLADIGVIVIAHPDLHIGGFRKKVANALEHHLVKIIEEKSKTSTPHPEVQAKVVNGSIQNSALHRSEEAAG